MRMKHRWIVIAAFTVTLVLGGCRPADSGAGESSGADESNAAPSTTSAEPSASSTPYTMDDY
jgi:hypothetical protein